MNSGVHLGYAWLLGNAADFSLGERRAVAIAGVAADFDMLAAVLGRNAFASYHHLLFHNLLFAGIMTLGVFLLFSRNYKLMLFCALAGILHLSLDFAGSHWDLRLFWPFSRAAVNLTWLLPEWLVAYIFQGTGTAGMFALMLWVFLKKGRTFFEIFTRKGDRLVMKFLTLPWRRRCGECGAPAFYQCSGCGAYMCMRHRKIAKEWRILCGNCLEKDLLPEAGLAGSGGP